MRPSWTSSRDCAAWCSSPDGVILHRSHYVRLLAGLLLVALSAVSGRAQTVTLHPSAEPRPLYRWATDRCEDEFIPDAPARAFRRADGRMVLLATHRENWALVGADLASLAPECRSVLRSSSLTPQRVGELWIEATYTRDGREVIALVSQDLSRQTRESGCDRRNLPGRCWLNNILAARSSDMGQRFSLLPPVRRMVATLGDEYPTDARTRFGVFTTSNIVRHGEAFYMVAHMQGEGVQEAGNCLFRTHDPFEPQAWRAWDGQDFTADFAGPGQRRPCATLPSRSLPGEVRSLGWSPRHGLWIASFLARLRLPGDPQPLPGFYYATSPDLLTWEDPRRIKTSPTRPRLDDLDTVTNYPAILDPDSASRNFETIDGDQPVLLYTLHHLRDGRGTMNRDLMVLPLRME